LLDSYADPNRAARDDLRATRTSAWKIRTDLETAIDRARAEPHRPHTIGTDRALAILAATQSFALVSMELESGLETMPPAPPLPAIVPFRDCVDRAAREIAEALRENRPAVLDGTLATSYVLLSSQRAKMENPSHRFVIFYASGYVQSLETLAELTSVPKPQ
jgi:hypothetical protein